MSRVFRVFVDSVPEGRETPLCPEDARHLARVLRLGPGAEVEGFDGRGSILRGVLTRLSPQEGSLLVKEVSVLPPPPRPNLSLALALIRPDPFEWAIQKAVELGCQTLIPLVSRFTDPAARSSAERALSSRWPRIARESLKQCRRNREMVLTPLMTFPDLLKRKPAGPGLLLHPYEASPLSDLLQSVQDPPEEIVLAVGPEGGWSDEEVKSALEAGYSAFSMGSLILRAETAAVASLSLCAARWHWNLPTDSPRPLSI